MAKTTVQTLREVSEKLNDGDTLCLQQVIYDYGDGTNGDPVFRFIRKDTQGRLKAQRGQAAIPSIPHAERLMKEMNAVALKFSIPKPQV